jgi:integrase
VWDTDLPAFGCEVLPSGAKSYRLAYRFGGRARNLTLGRHGSITPDEARTLAKKALGSIAHGDDPAGERSAARRGITMNDAYEEWLVRHVEPKRKSATKLEYRRIYATSAAAALGKRMLADITRADVTALHRKLGDSRYTANRLVAVLRSFFNYCERQGMRPENSNPARLIERYRETSRERFLTADELARLGAALKESETLEWPWAIAAIRLLLFTGARRGEVLGLRWDEIELGAGVARLPDSKTGAKTMYLSGPARDVLAGIPRQSGNPFVICGRPAAGVAESPLVGLPKIWDRVRKRAGLNDLRLHDLRHAFASSAAMGGESLLTVGKMLGHSQPSVTAKYAHYASAPLVQAADRIAETIAAQLNAPVTPEAGGGHGTKPGIRS